MKTIKIRFTGNDYDKLISSGFEVTDNGNYWKVEVDNVHSGEIARYYRNKEILEIRYNEKADIVENLYKNLLIYWLVYESYETPELKDIYQKIEEKIRELGFTNYLDFYVTFYLITNSYETEEVAREKVVDFKFVYKSDTIDSINFSILYELDRIAEEIKNKCYVFEYRDMHTGIHNVVSFEYKPDYEELSEYLKNGGDIREYEDIEDIWEIDFRKNFKYNGDTYTENGCLIINNYVTTDGVIDLYAFGGVLQENFGLILGTPYNKNRIRNRKNA